jgi:phosphohistidine phosphatase
MRVILFRHGPAGERDSRRWPDDRLRSLTSGGEARSRRAARGLLRLEGDLGRVFTSPLARCLQTAEILAQARGLDTVPETLEGLAPRGSWRVVLTRIAEESPDATIALVGHEPELGKLAGVMLFGAPRALALKKAGGCSIEFSGAISSGKGELRWFLPPRALARIAASRSKA